MVRIRYKGHYSMGEGHVYRFTLCEGKVRQDETADISDEEWERLQRDYKGFKPFPFELISKEARSVDEPPRDRMKRRAGRKRGG